MRKIAVVTTSRADYGLLYWLMKAIQAERSLKLQVIATGSHLSGEFGMTSRQIENDGFKIAARVPLLASADAASAVARALAQGTAGFARALSKLKPDLLVVLGDRVELLAAASASVALRLPIAHLHGGEASEGVLDEQVRHAVTKLSHLHFPAAEPYKKRLLRMGEQPRRVFNVGAPGLEYIKRMKRLPLLELELRLGLNLRNGFLLCTFHPAAIGRGRVEPVAPLLAAMAATGLPCVVSLGNADAGGRALNASVKAWARRNHSRRKAVASLGQLGYLSLASYAKAVVGNSSSGIIEIPSLRVPTVNVGERQRGRLRAPSVVDCAPTQAAIAAALKRVLSPAFRRRCSGRNPYGSGDTAAKIVKVLKTVDLGESLLRKSFHEG